jgi:hypothetical protein
MDNIMNTLTKTKTNTKTDKFLDVKVGKYNLGVVPNMIINRMIHEISFAVVKKQLIDKHNHRQCWQEVMGDLSDHFYYKDYQTQDDDYDMARNDFIEMYGTYEENPEAYAFYSDLVCGV